MAQKKGDDLILGPLVTSLGIEFPHVAAFDQAKQASFHTYISGRVLANSL
jgi:hypothetical protein